MMNIAKLIFRDASKLAYSWYCEYRDVTSWQWSGEVWIAADCKVSSQIAGSCAVLILSVFCNWVWPFVGSMTQPQNKAQLPFSSTTVSTFRKSETKQRRLLLMTVSAHPWYWRYCCCQTTIAVVIDDQRSTNAAHRH